MRLDWKRPRVVEVYDAPQLAVLAVLEAALDVAAVALVAAHPDEPDPADVPFDDRAAHALIKAIRVAGAAIDRYRVALTLTREHGGADLPF